MSALGAQVSIEKLIPEGKALGHLSDGRVVMVSGAVPGDRIELTRVSEAKGLVRVQSFRLCEPSPLRITPRCPVVEQCGGCDWMLLSAEEQRRQKLLVLAEALRRTGGIELGERVPQLFAAASTSGYRSRVRLQIVGDHIGFFGRESHQLVEPEHCAVSSERVNRGLARLRQLAGEHPGALAAFTSVELRVASDDSSSVYLERSRAPRSAATQAWLAALRREFLVAESDAVHATPPLLQRFDLGAEVYLLAAPGSFTQVNWEVNRLLIERVQAGARDRGVRSFLDAYAGAGNFALPLLAAGLSGIAVEANASSILAAREAARQQSLPSAGFVNEDVARWARREVGRQFDLVLLDPPRSGVKQGLQHLAAMASSWLVMCSCNPVTLARDLRALIGLGFELDAIEAFDMFPETHHLETLAWLRAPHAGARPVEL